MIRTVGHRRAERELRRAKGRLTILQLRQSESTARKIQTATRAAIARRLSDGNRRRGGRGRGLGSWTGNLASYITYELRKTRYGARVVVGPEDYAIYGWLHEWGLGGYPVRPWFNPVAKRTLEGSLREWDRKMGSLF